MKPLDNISAGMWGFTFEAPRGSAGSVHISSSISSGGSTSEEMNSQEIKQATEIANWSFFFLKMSCDSQRAQSPANLVLDEPILLCQHQDILWTEKQQLVGRLLKL